ncbi:MAG: hypothetical protein K8R59_06475 [Thermoanaerobaculales bacterium]|nr:hypothetical protein [Thermoanaerobaculales bacterium]
MRERGISTIASVFLAAVAGLATATILMDWVVVAVDIPEPENISLKIPFPLIVADVALAFIPDEVADEVEIPRELLAQRKAILSGLGALIDGPDMNLVEVSSPDADVIVRKEGDSLKVSVDAEDAKVNCTLPLGGMHQALEKWDWKSFEPRLALKALHQAHRGTLVEVEAEDGTYVKITKW